jgi:hypothetical protein
MRNVNVFNLIFITLNSYLQYMPNTNDINKACFMISGNYFTSYIWCNSIENVHGMQKHNKGPHAVHRLTTPDQKHKIESQWYSSITSSMEGQTPSQFR